MTELMKLYKLMILYILSKVNFPMTNDQICRFFLGREYLSYFRLQEALSELESNNLVLTESTHNRTFYTLSEEGSETLSFFKENIPADFRRDIDLFLSEKEYQLREEVAVKADYTLNSNHEYTVRCQVFEQDAPLIELLVTVPTEEAAQKLSDNWQKKNQEVYAMIMAELLSR